MTSIDFKFEEIPLVLANYSSPTPPAVALISGSAEITYSRVHGDDGASFEFDIESIEISAPIVGWSNVSVKWVRDNPGNQRQRYLWEIISKSVERARTDAIYQANREAIEP